MKFRPDACSFLGCHPEGALLLRASRRPLIAAQSVTALLVVHHALATSALLSGFPARKRDAPPLRMTHPRSRLGFLRRPLPPRFCFGLREHARDPRPAIRTASVLHLVRHHGMPRARNHDLLAARADRVCAVGVDVAL